MTTPSAVVVVIPARDEEAVLPGCPRVGRAPDGFASHLDDLGA